MQKLKTRNAAVVTSRVFTPQARGDGFPAASLPLCSLGVELENTSVPSVILLERIGSQFLW